MLRRYIYANGRYAIMSLRIRNEGRMNEEQAVREFLGDRPGSEELTEWRITLEARLRRLESERDKGGAPDPRLVQKISQLKKQISALRQEEAITQFVEDSVRVTLAMGSVVDAGEFDGVPEIKE
jgi:hypothetical protein